MRPITAVEPHVRDNILSEAAARNLPADLMVMLDENLHACLSSRILHRDNGRVLLDVPAHNGRPVLLRPGQFIEVYFRLDHEHFGFDSRVIGYEQFKLNASRTAEVLGVEPPQFLERRQRRKFYRLSLAALPPVPIELTPEDGGPVLSGRLANLSAGGMAVLPEPSPDAHFACDRKYTVRFELPGCGRRFAFQAVVCHVRHVFQNRQQVVGMALLPELDPMTHRDQIELIARFVAEQQREMLFTQRMGSAISGLDG